MGEGSTNLTNPHHTPTFIQLSPQPQKTQRPRKPKRKDTQISQSSDPSDNVADEAVHKELGDSLVRAATTASSLEEEQDSGNITKTQSKATPNESSSLGTTSGGGPRCQETMGDTIAQTRFENVSKHSNDSLLVRARVESFDDEEILGEDASKQGRIDAIDADKEITLVSVHDMNVSAGEEVAEEVVKVINNAKLIIDATQVSAAGDKVSTASAAVTVIAEEVVGVINTAKLIIDAAQDSAAGDIVSAASDATTYKTQEERLAREKAEKEEEANIALIETWDDIQANIDVDHQLAKRMQAREQEELSIEEKATLFQQLLKKRRKHFAAKRAEVKRNKPPTKAQQRKIMCNYLKNVKGYKLKDLKLKEFDSI
ncbi:hypothetical protein Tco_1568225 [Tanacetum coccineum]